MESKTLDFFQHEENCSLKCQSRNYIKNRKAEAAELALFESMMANNNNNCVEKNNNNTFNNLQTTQIFDTTGLSDDCE